MFSTMTEFLHQSPKLKTKNLTKLTTEHLMKLEKTDGYFPNLGENELVYLKNHFTTNTQVLRAGTSMQENLIKLQQDDTRGMYSA